MIILTIIGIIAAIVVPFLIYFLQERNKKIQALEKVIQEVNTKATIIQHSNVYITSSDEIKNTINYIATTTASPIALTPIQPFKKNKDANGEIK